MEPKGQLKDEVYLGIWQVEQAHVRIRWTVATFFFGLSFAITGFSFQYDLQPIHEIGSRVISIFVYWFGYVMFLRFYQYTLRLRNYLLKLEQEERTSIKLHTEMKQPENKQLVLNAPKLLAVFGIGYSAIVGLLLFLTLAYAT